MKYWPLILKKTMRRAVANERANEQAACRTAMATFARDIKDYKQWIGEAATCAAAGRDENRGWRTRFWFQMDVTNEVLRSDRWQTDIRRDLMQQIRDEVNRAMAEAFLQPNGIYPVCSRVRDMLPSPPMHKERQA